MEFRSHFCYCEFSLSYPNSNSYNVSGLLEKYLLFLFGDRITIIREETNLLEVWLFISQLYYRSEPSATSISRSSLHSFVVAEA